MGLFLKRDPTEDSVSLRRKQKDFNEHVTTEEVVVAVFDESEGGSCGTRRKR